MIRGIIKKLFITVTVRDRVLYKDWGYTVILYIGPIYTSLAPQDVHASGHVALDDGVTSGVDKGLSFGEGEEKEGQAKPDAESAKVGWFQGPIVSIGHSNPKGP